jgi:hypothetical protein
MPRLLITIRQMGILASGTVKLTFSPKRWLQTQLHLQIHKSHRHSTLTLLPSSAQSIMGASQTIAPAAARVHKSLIRIVLVLLSLPTLKSHRESLMALELVLKLMEKISILTLFLHQLIKTHGLEQALERQPQTITAMCKSKLPVTVPQQPLSLLKDLLGKPNALISLSLLRAQEPQHSN